MNEPVTAWYRRLRIVAQSPYRFSGAESGHSWWSEEFYRLVKGTAGPAAGPDDDVEVMSAEALEYTQSRTLFGRPLAHTQSVQIRLAHAARRARGVGLRARAPALAPALALAPAHGIDSIVTHRARIRAVRGRAGA